MTHDELATLIEKMREHPCYLLLAVPRAGNTAIWTALNTHPMLNWLGEVWGAEAQGKKFAGLTVGERLMESWGKLNGGSTCTGLPCYFAEPLHPESWSIAVPFTGKMRNAEAARYEEILQRFFWSVTWSLKDHLTVIRLTRRDELARAVSALHARAVGAWHAWDKRGRFRLKTAPAVLLSPADIEVAVARGRERYEQQKKHFPDALEVFYEDFVAHKQDTFARICDHLGVPQHKITPGVRKNPTHWRDRVLNYQEIRKHFQNKPEFAHSFEEG